MWASASWILRDSSLDENEQCILDVLDYIRMTQLAFLGFYAVVRELYDISSHPGEKSRNHDTIGPESRDFLSLGDLIDNLITPSFSDEKNKPSNLANYQNNVRQIRDDFEKAIRGQYPAKINEIATALDQAFANDDKKEAFRLLLRLGKIHYLENIIGSVTDNEK